MATETPIPLDIPPGVITEQSPLAGAGRFTDCSWVRFWRGKAEKMGGYVALYSNTTNQGILGKPRGASFWVDNSQNEYVAIGTEIKLYALPEPTWTPTDITPWRVNAVKNNPISTTAGSADVNIAYTSHGASAGDYVDISGASNVDNFAPNGSWLITAVPDANNVTIVAPQAALNTVASGGGASVTIGFEISPGSADVQTGFGWGAGTWGTGTWGTPRIVAASAFTPRSWTFGSFGKVLVACPINGAVYSYDPTVPGARATYIATAPTACSGVVVTSDRIVIAYGSSYDPGTTLDGGPTHQDKMQWWASAQGDYTNWNTVAVAGPAGSPSVVGTLVQGSRIVGARDLGIHITLFWTDTALYSFQYTGSQYVFNIMLVGRECGLEGPMAAVTVGTRAFWRGINGFFLFDGSVQRIPNHQDVTEWVNHQIRANYTVKTICWYNQRFNEVWWAFVSGDDTEPFSYVAVNLDDWTWTKGRFPEGMSSATQFQGYDTRPLVIGADGDLYQMDNGVDADGQPAPWSLTWGPIEVSSGSVSHDVSGVAMDMERQNGSISIQLDSYDRTPAGATVLDTMTQSAAPPDTMVDFRVSGRQVVMTWSGGTQTGDDFRLGVPKLLTTPSGARR